MRFIIIAISAILLLSCNNNDFTGKTHINEILKEADILKVRESAPKLIGKDWMLVSAGNSEKFNAMTASWGGLGELWGKQVAFIFIRPQRYTFEFLENGDYFTLTFFDEKYRDALNIMGSKSGRNSDKITEAGITPITTDNGMCFAEGKIVIECKKLYADFLNDSAFIDKSIIDKHYEKRDFHKMYVGEIVKVWRK